MAETNGTARWQLVVTIAGLVFLVTAALIGLLLTINTQGSQIAAMAARIEAVEHDNSLLRDRVVTTQGTVTSIQRDLIEVETQFCAQDTSRNLIHADDLRVLALLWRRSFDTDFPVGNAYYPQVGRCGFGR